MNAISSYTKMGQFTKALVLGGLIALGIPTDSFSADVNRIITSTENSSLEHYRQEVRKYFPDNIDGDQFMEKLSTLRGTILAYEDIIQELDDPARTGGMKLIERQNVEIDKLMNEYQGEERLRKIYKKLQEHLAEILLFLEKNTPKEPEQCRNPNFTI